VRVFERPLHGSAQGFGPPLVIGPDHARAFGWLIGSELAEAIAGGRPDPDDRRAYQVIAAAEPAPELPRVARPNRAARRRRR